jgi:hypothetical protein
MNADNVNWWNTSFWRRNLERTIYAVLSVILIGHVFFINGLVEAINVLLLWVGTAFGFITTFQLTPVCDFLDNSENRISPHVLSIVRDDEAQKATSIDTECCAA